jgi:hypothetical protein
LAVGKRAPHASVIHPHADSLLAAGLASHPVTDSLAVPTLDDGERRACRDGRVSFCVRIGVTGHRDIANCEALRPLVRERLDEIRAAFPASTRTAVSFVILSSLAEGSDRLVAREALEAYADAGVQLHAVLPLCAEDYAKDFRTTRSRQEFYELLAAASACIEMPATDDRDTAYERAGHYVVDNSDSVIALWDGRGAGGRGGTAAIVHYATDAEIPVLVVGTPRTRAPGEPVRTRQAPARIVAHRNAVEAYQRVSEFNRGSIQDVALARMVGSEAARLRRFAARPRMRRQFEAVASWALPLLVRADVLAMKHQRRYFRLSAVVYLLAALAVAVVAAQWQARLSPKLALLEVALMLAILAIYGVARRVGVHERWISYRSLAEAFRSSLFMALSDAPARDGKRDRDRPEGRVPWFQRIFSTAWADRPQVSPKAVACSELRQFLIEGWLNDQIKYHEEAVERYQRARLRLTRAVFGLFGVTVVVGCLHAFDVVGGVFWPRMLVFLAVALPGFGAALTGIRDQRHYRIHEHRSGRTVVRLQGLRENMASGRTLRSLQKLAVQVQNAMEAEKLDWSGVAEFQDLEVVI